MISFKRVSIIVLFSIIVSLSSAYAAEVKITGEKGSWKLLVDQEEFYIRGVGCGLAKGKQDEDFLKLAKELGANCVRTWGIERGDKEYLDKAREYGLMVDAGIWLNWPDAEKGISYIGENAYKERIWKQTLDYIRKFKDHPAILIWNAGNEVLFFSKSEEEKIAFCVFLESLIQEIHKIDPKHPVTYASSAHLNLKYLKKYVPSLDIIGMNIYCSPRIVHGTWDFLGIDKPYLITEYGPYLPCDSRRDRNGKAIELGDYQKAIFYRDYTQQIQSFKGYNLGGFVFHLGDTSQESMTWWNINEGNSRRQSYWEIYKIYTGKTLSYSALRICSLFLSKDKDLQPGELIDVKVKMIKKEIRGLSFEYRLSTTLENILEHYVNEYIDIEVIGNGNEVKIKVPQERGTYRLYCFVKDKNGNISSANKTISVTDLR